MMVDQVRRTENNQSWVCWIDGWLRSRPPDLLTDGPADWLTRWLFMCWLTHGWFSETHWSVSPGEIPAREKTSTTFLLTSFHQKTLQRLYKWGVTGKRSTAQRQQCSSKKKIEWICSCWEHHKTQIKIQHKNQTHGSLLMVKQHSNSSTFPPKTSNALNNPAIKIYHNFLTVKLHLHYWCLKPPFYFIHIFWTMQSMSNIIFHAVKKNNSTQINITALPSQLTCHGNSWN